MIDDPHPSGPHGGSEPSGAPPIRVLSGNPTDEETAAIAALFTHLRLERAASTTALPGVPSHSAWDRRARAIRTTPQPGTRWQDR